MEDIFGFSLCTDDSLCTLFQVSCTRQWVQEEEGDYPGIGFIFTEWKDSADDALFQKLSDRLAALANAPHESDAERARVRDERFEALVLALSDARKQRLFADDTLLCVGSTDPSEHLESLAMDAVDRLNTRAIVDQFAEHLGYEVYRKKR